jgi:hypothetical protein
VLILTFSINHHIGNGENRFIAVAFAGTSSGVLAATYDQVDMMELLEMFKESKKDDKDDISSLDSSNLNQVDDYCVTGEHQK